MEMKAELKQEVHSALRLHNVYVDKASYDGGDMPFDDKKEPSSSFSCGFQCEISFPKDLSALVKLGCEITTPESNKKLSLNVCGDFSYGQDLAEDEDKLNRVLSVNAVAILFPYLRSNVSTFSSMTDMDGHFKVPLINASKLFSVSKSN